VRHPLVSRIVRAYDQRDRRAQAAPRAKKSDDRRS
jgi:phosphate starvation-inducible protein PhoH